MTRARKKDFRLQARQTHNWYEHFTRVDAYTFDNFSPCCNNSVVWHKAKRSCLFDQMKDMKQGYLSLNMLQVIWNPSHGLFITIIKTAWHVSVFSQWWIIPSWTRWEVITLKCKKSCYISAVVVWNGSPIFKTAKNWTVLQWIPL